MPTESAITDQNVFAIKSENILTLTWICAWNVDWESAIIRTISFKLKTVRIEYDSATFKIITMYWTHIGYNEIGDASKVLLICFFFKNERPKRLKGISPNKHKALMQCCLTAGPPSTSLANSRTTLGKCLSLCLLSLLAASRRRSLCKLVWWTSCCFFLGLLSRQRERFGRCRVAFKYTGCISSTSRKNLYEIILD